MLRLTTIVSVLIAFGICLPAFAGDGLADADKNCGAAIAAAALPQLAINAPADAQIDLSAGCSAYAVCDNGSTISCSTSVSGASCVGVDASCPEERGYVTCNGQTTSCLACPGGGSGGCWVQGAPCSSNGYCAAKCSAYCNTEGGYCSGGSCQCLAF